MAVLIHNTFINIITREPVQRFILKGQDLMTD